eukprot:1193830-Prorocentrum_minimum.AAC.2
MRLIGPTCAQHAKGRSLGAAFKALLTEVIALTRAVSHPHEFTPSVHEFTPPAHKFTPLRALVVTATTPSPAPSTVSAYCCNLVHLQRLRVSCAQDQEREIKRWRD